MGIGCAHLSHSYRYTITIEVLGQLTTTAQQDLGIDLVVEVLV